MTIEALKVACPCCRNKRLFDIAPETVGTIEIKCPRCGRIIVITIKNKKIRTEQIGAC